MPQLPSLGVPLSGHHSQRSLSSGSQGSLHRDIKCLPKSIKIRIQINQSFHAHVSDVADRERTQSGFVKWTSVHELPLPSSVTLRTECLLHLGFLTQAMGTDNNNAQSSPFTGLSIKSVFTRESASKNASPYTHTSLKTHYYYCGSKLFRG